MLLIEEKKTGTRRQVSEEAWEKLKNEFGTAHKYRLLGSADQVQPTRPEPPSEVAADLRKRKKPASGGDAEANDAADNDAQ